MLRMHKLLFLGLLFKLVVSNNLEECGRINLDLGSNLFALTSDDTVERTAPWIAAIGAFRESTEEGFEQFVVSCSGTILTKVL